MTRPAKVVIDTDSLQHNLSRVRELVDGAKIMAVIKADGYGHGLVRVATALTSADAFGVACLEEAEKLRSARFAQPIVLLEGPYTDDELTHIHALGLEIVVHHELQLQMLEKVALPAPINVWLKIDTGMHRLGFAADVVKSTWDRLLACNTVANIRLMTHLACADETDHSMTSSQITTIKQISQQYDAELSIANSAAVIAHPQSHADWVRPGLMLYGVSPFLDSTSDNYELRPAMTLLSELIAVKQIKRGDSVGYGATWQCPEDMNIGIVAIGYGDGYPRHALSGTPIIVNGQRTQIIGRVSMDMLTVDLRTIPAAKTGDPVELWGSQLPVEEVARHAGTISYELLCAMHKRLRFMERGKS